MIRAGRAWRWLANAQGPMRAGVVCLLCAVTVAVLISDIRYRTQRSGLFPGVATGHWDVSPRGVSVLNADSSVIILSALEGPQFPYLVNQIGSPRQHSHVRIRAEMATQGLRAGSQAWQRARILFWSYDESGRRLRYLPHELGALDGTSDWHRMSLVVPVLPEIRLMRFIIYNGGLEGRMLVRNITVDEVVETRLFRILRLALVSLWALAGVWAMLPVLAGARRRPMAGVALLVGATILAGTLAPQPLLSDLLAPVEDAATRVATALLTDRDGQEPEVRVMSHGDPAPAGSKPGGEPIAAAPGEARQPEDARVAFTADWAPQMEAAVAAHLAAFVALGFLLPLAFPGTGWGALFLYMVVFSVAIETVQGFYVSRTPELRDLLANLAGIPAGFMLALLLQRFGVRRRQ